MYIYNLLMAEKSQKLLQSKCFCWKLLLYLFPKTKIAMQKRTVAALILLCLLLVLQKQMAPSQGTSAICLPTRSSSSQQPCGVRRASQCCAGWGYASTRWQLHVGLSDKEEFIPFSFVHLSIIILPYILPTPVFVAARGWHRIPQEMVKDKTHKAATPAGKRGI